MTWKSVSAYQTELWQIQHAKSTTILRDLALSPHYLPPLFCQFFENDFLLFHSPSIQFVGSWEIDVEPTDHSSRNLLFLSDKKKSEEHREQNNISALSPLDLFSV